MFTAYVQLQKAEFPHPAHLLQHQNTVARPHGLGQLCNPAFVQVRPREAPVVEVDLWAAILDINYY